ALIFGIAFGIAFLVITYVSETYCIQCLAGNKKTIFVSSVAGISVSFFFLELLPYITKTFPVLPIESLLFLIIMIGFVFIHLTEKWILQDVEKKSQKRINDIKKAEAMLVDEEKRIESSVIDKIRNEEIDDDILKSLADTDIKIKEKERELLMEESHLKKTVINHIYKDLVIVNTISDYVYHFLIGLILVDLLATEIFAAFLFFAFAAFKTLISNPLKRHVEIHFGNEEYEFHMHRGKGFLEKSLLSTATSIGIVVGLLLDIFFYLDQFWITVIFAFIGGEMMYIIVREVIPEKGKGRPSYFLISTVAFSVLIFILNVIEIVFSIY
ncbi:MAG: hypothetical protein ACTSSI_10270, partial [Candidatus Helarchaeota archaeon]